MGEEDIEVKEQWDVIETMRELDSLRATVIRFIEHTAQTMSRPEVDQYGHQTGSFVHPMGSFIATIDSCQQGCYRRYGEDMYRQGQLFDVHFQKQDE